MSRPDRKWRPSDADRERYATAVSQAFAEGRIDATDMESRTALVYKATSIADLDALVEDMPAPAPPGAHAASPGARRSPKRTSGVVAGGLVALMAIAGFVVAGILNAGDGSGADDVAQPVVEEAPAPVDPADLPPIATEQVELFDAENLEQMIDTLAAGGVTHLHQMYLRNDSAEFQVRAATEVRAIDEFDYVAGRMMTPEPVRGLGDTEVDEDVFLPLPELTADALWRVIEDSPAAAEAPDADVDFVVLRHRSTFDLVDGQLVETAGFILDVYLDDTANTSYLTWDLAGETVLDLH